MKPSTRKIKNFGRVQRTNSWTKNKLHNQSWNSFDHRIRHAEVEQKSLLQLPMRVANSLLISVHFTVRNKLCGESAKVTHVRPIQPDTPSPARSHQSLFISRFVSMHCTVGTKLWSASAQQVATMKKTRARPLHADVRPRQKAMRR